SLLRRRNHYSYSFLCLQYGLGKIKSTIIGCLSTHFLNLTTILALHIFVVIAIRPLCSPESTKRFRVIIPQNRFITCILFLFFITFSVVFLLICIGLFVFFASGIFIRVKVH